MSTNQLLTLSVLVYLLTLGTFIMVVIIIIIIIDYSLLFLQLVSIPVGHSQLHWLIVLEVREGGKEREGGRAHNY